MSMNQMEQFLSNLPYLKYLELIVHCLTDFIDGQRWEILTKPLEKFYFKFYLPFDVKSDDLNSFQTSYWLEEKCWLVRGENCCLYSIPHFAPDHIDITKWSDEWPIQSVNAINIKGVPRNQFPPYTHIKKLYINCLLSRKQILSIVDLRELEHLSILSIEDLLMFAPFESTIPNLCELIIKNTLAFHMIEQLKGYQLKQIRKLLVSISAYNTNVIIQELFYVFPHVEYLTYLSDVRSMEIMIRLIDGFVYLSNATFCAKALYPDSNFITEYSNRLMENNFTYRIQQLSSDRSLFAIHWWIAAQVSLSYSVDVYLFHIIQPLQSPIVAHWPSGYRYILYQIKYLIFQSADTVFDRLLLHSSVFCIVSQLVAPLCASLLHIRESIFGYSSLSLYIYYLVLSGIIYSLILISFAYVTFTSSSGTRGCILFIIFQYCILNQCCRIWLNADIHSAIGTICMTIYEMRYALYMGFKWLFEEWLHVI
jgi:hypothetical protein